MKKSFPSLMHDMAAVQQQKYGPFGRLLQKLCYIWNDRLYILETYKEPQEALLEVLPYCLVFAAADLHTDSAHCKPTMNWKAT